MAEIRGEGLGKDALFIGNAIKVIEHLQGTRHLIRFATRHPDDRRLNLFSIQQRESEVCGSWLPVTDQMLPIRYVSSYQISRMLNYNEAELHDLIRYASSEKQQRFARAAIMATYQTIAEYFSIARPVVEMSVQREDPQYVELQQRWDGSTDLKEKLVLMDAIKIYANNKLREDLNSARQERAKAQDGQTQYRFETKGRMINLYRWAADSGYLPISSTPLAKLNRG
jgi:hypothetical protein